MIDLNHHHFSRWADFVSAVTEAIQFPGAVRLQAFEADSENTLLAKLALDLGKVVADRPRADQQALVENGFITRIESRPQPVKDNLGFNILSSTAEEFPPHTDHYLHSHPADVVMFQCVTYDPAGGETLLIYLRNILENIKTEYVPLLRKVAYPTHFGKVAIIEGNDVQTSIRYNRVEIERAAKVRQEPLDAEQELALDALDEAIQAAAQRFALHADECLVVNNRTALHGRTAFSPQSGRLLKRVRLHFDSGRRSNTFS